MSHPDPPTRTPQAVLLIGVQATGKSTFVRQRLFDSHVRINLDMLRTRNRERILVGACIEAGQSFVVDNTNPTRADRRRYIEPARAAGLEVVGYYFRSAIADALQRNARRTGAGRVPDAGVLGTYGRLELPTPDEGFDRLYFVSQVPEGERAAPRFEVEEWKNEV